MEKKVNYAVVGLFVILLGSAWLAISVWLVFGEITADYTRYRVYMDESVSGLYKDAPVKYRGVEVGKVHEIGLNPLVLDQVQLMLDIRTDVPIREDTVALLTAQGLTGVAFIDLTGGSLASPPLQARVGELYPVIKSGPSLFSRVDSLLTDLVLNLNTLAKDVTALLDGDEKQALRETILNIRDITAAVADQKTALATSVERLPALLARVDETAGKFEQMASKVAVTSESINRYVSNSGAGVQQFSQQTLPEFAALISELRRLADTMQGFGRKLEEDPRVLLYGRGLEAPGPGE